MSLYTLTVDLLARTGSFERDMGKSARIAERDAKRIQAAAIRIGTAIATAATGAAAGVTYMVQRNIAAMDQTAKMADQIGIATDHLVAMRYAAVQMAGVSEGQFDMAMRRMTRRIAEAAEGGGPAAAAIDRMGLSAKELARLEPDEQFRRIADAIRATSDQGTRLRNVMALMDSEGMPLVTMLSRGADAIRNMEKEARALGLTFNDETARAAQAFGSSMTRARAAAEGFATQIAAELLPRLNEVTESLVNVHNSGSAAASTASVIGRTFDIAAGNAQGLAAGIRATTVFIAEMVNQSKAWYEIVSNIGTLGFAPGTVAGGWQRSDRGVTQLREALGEEWQAYKDAMDRIWNGSSYESAAPKIAAAMMELPDLSESQAAAAQANRDLERQLESIARYNREAEMAAATLAGPLQAAEVAHRHRLADLDAELKKGNISQSAYNTLKGEAADQLERTTRALQEQQRAPDALLSAMREEADLLGMIGPEREIYRRGLQAERGMRDAINRANEAGAGIGDDLAESLVRQARAHAANSLQVEEANRAIEDWRYTIGRNVDGVADLFADLFSGQIKSTRDFFTELKDIWKRGWRDIVRMSMQQSFVNPIQRALAGMMSGQGFAGAGMGPGAMAQGLAGTVMLGGGGATAIGAGASTGALYPGWGFAGAGVGGLGGPGGVAGGGFGMPGMMPSRNLLTGEFAGGMPYASAALGILGAYYGLTQRGNNALTSGLAGLSYGALGIGVGGAIAGGLGAIGTGAGLAGVGAGAMGGATSAMGTAAGAIGSTSWIPVVGWTLAALGAIDAISGGRLFGTKYQAQSITQDIGIDAYGGVASASVHETRKRSLFRGTARRDRSVETTAEQREAAADLYDAMERVARSAATQLGLSTVQVVSGSIRQVFDRDGNLQSEIATVLGRTYEETFEQFTSRLASEQLIAAVGQIDSAASRIAQDWRNSAEVLAEGAEFFMTAASDARSGLDLWTGIGLQALTDFVGQMQMGEETLGQAYSRLAGIAGDYGSLITDINTQIVGEGLNDYQQQALQIERTYRQQVKAANDYAKALGLSGARSQDLAKIEELRALNMGKLQAQMEASNAAFLGQLALSDLSTLRDDQKLAEAMGQLADAAAAGDTQAAQQAAQAALGFGRNLYASGRDYQSLYDQVTGQLRGMTLDPDDLDMGDLADEIEAMHEGISRALFELAARGEQTITAPIRAEQQRTNELLGHVLEELRRQGSSAAAGRLREELNSRSPVLVR